jgi:hypothetical protein
MYSALSALTSSKPPTLCWPPVLAAPAAPQTLQHTIKPCRSTPASNKPPCCRFYETTGLLWRPNLTPIWRPTPDDVPAYTFRMLLSAKILLSRLSHSMGLEDTLGTLLVWLCLRRTSGACAIFLRVASTRMDSPPDRTEVPWQPRLQVRSSSASRGARNMPDAHAFTLPAFLAAPHLPTAWHESQSAAFQASTPLLLCSLASASWLPKRRMRHDDFSVQPEAAGKACCVPHDCARSCC